MEEISPRKSYNYFGLFNSKIFGSGFFNFFSKPYLVEIISKSKEPCGELWKFTANGKTYSHPRVKRISGQNFYNIVAGEKNALENLFDVLHNAIDSFMSKHEKFKEEENHVADELRLIIGKDLDINEDLDINKGFKYFFEKAYKP